jgi:hypothetical protein
MAFINELSFDKRAKFGYRDILFGKPSDRFYARPDSVICKVRNGRLQFALPSLNDFAPLFLMTYGLLVLSKQTRLQVRIFSLTVRLVILDRGQTLCID